MRLLFSNSMKIWGGGENWSLTTARSLSTRGHIVFLACQPGGELHRRALESGGNIVVVPLVLRGDINPCAVLRMRSFLRRERIQLVCCNLDREVRSIGVAARMCGGIPFVRRRGSDYAFRNSLRYRISYSLLVDRVIVNSDSTMRTITETNHWMPPAKLHRIYNGIPVERFFHSEQLRKATRKELGYEDGEFVVGMVGALLPRKRHMTLIRAASLLRNRIPRLRLMIVGPERDQAYLRDLRDSVEDLGLEGAVLFQGSVQNINRFYNAMDVLAMPSENEGFGYAAAEAMAAEVPVIVSDASSLPEVVGENGKAGLVFPLYDHSKLAEKIAFLWQSPEIGRKIAVNGRHRILDNFTLDRMVSDTEAFFRELVEDLPGGSVSVLPLKDRNRSKKQNGLAGKFHYSIQS